MFDFPDEAIRGRISKANFRYMEDMFNFLVSSMPDLQKEAINFEIIADYISMAACLTSEILKEHFKKLDSELTKKLKAQNLVTDDLKIIKKDNKKYTSNYKVFTQFFTEWAHKHGFNTENLPKALPDTMPSILGILSRECFSNLLSLGYLFKDVGAGKKHGEFSHILQLYIIIEENKQNPFLTKNPIELYQSMAAYPYIYESHALATPWNIVFDNDLTQDIDDYYSEASRICGFLRGKDKDFADDPSFISEIPILSQIILGRYQKREIHEDFLESNFEELEKFYIEKNKSKAGLFFNNNIFFPIKKSEKLNQSDFSAKAEGNIAKNLKPF